MEATAHASEVERRKQVKICLRRDLVITPQKYEGKTYYVVKDPVSLRYYRFKDQEYFLIKLMNGDYTLDQAQKEFEQRFRPERLTLEDLESFAQQLINAGLAYNESPQAGKQFYERRKKRKRQQLIQAFTNILYIKIPIFDPDKILTWMLRWLRFVFTTSFFVLSVGVMLAAVLLVATHFGTFRDKLPSYQEFFTFQTVAYMWVSLGAVKVIHEFGHGLSCKAFKGECHEIGALFLCLSPCLYCNVSDSWTLPNKWHRIIISFAGIYVELIIAALATFVWWNSSSQPVINNLSLSLMVVCSVSTVLFNANPLMRFDGYYVLADWIEIPNLRERSNRFLKHIVSEHCLGIEMPPEPYMALDRRILFVVYAVTSYIYRWVITFSILWFLYMFLQPYKLGALSAMLALAALGSMVGWPIYRLFKGLKKRGRLPDMKPKRVAVSGGVLGVVVLFFFLVPLPISRIRETALVEIQPDSAEQVFVTVPGVLKGLHIRDGQAVAKGELLAEFESLEVETRLEGARAEYQIRDIQFKALQEQIQQTGDPAQRAQLQVAQRTADGERRQYEAQVEGYEKEKLRLDVRAPRDGVVMAPPRIDDIGKYYDKEQQQALCSVGDPTRLRILVPVSPADYRLLKEDLAHDPNLAVTLRIQGRGTSTWQGKVSHVPESEAKEVPLALTHRAGGPLAIKPVAQPNVYIPQAQQFLIGIDIVDPDKAMCPGTLAQVKVHCRWRTCAWWVWRTISSTFDLGLI